jgi:hypothetical protein
MARGLKIAFYNLAGETFEAVSKYNLLVIPMFVLMVNIAGVSGMSNDLFSAAYRWMGHLRGGLNSATIAACAGFAALSGSSLASAVTMGRVALPEMKKYQYADSLATVSVAASGTLGFMIPPSGGMITYAVLTEQSIGHLCWRILHLCCGSMALLCELASLQTGDPRDDERHRYGFHDHHRRLCVHSVHVADRTARATGHHSDLAADRGNCCAVYDHHDDDHSRPW